MKKNRNQTLLYKLNIQTAEVKPQNSKKSERVESNHTPTSTSSPAIGFAGNTVSDLSGCQPLGSHTSHYTLSSFVVKNFIRIIRKKSFPAIVTSARNQQLAFASGKLRKSILNKRTVFTGFDSSLG